jgi:hypothetical protein
LTFSPLRYRPAMTPDDATSLLSSFERHLRAENRSDTPNQAAHDPARRRYDGPHAKAASTGFPEEAAACRAKAEQLRAKYGL